MGTVVRVPQTPGHDREELGVTEAWAGAARTGGGCKLLTYVFLRFSHADGFSFARALAFQFVLALVPFSIALGRRRDVPAHGECGWGSVESTLTRTAPGPSAELIRTSLGRTEEGGFGPGGELAVWLGFAFATLNLASAMAILSAARTESTGWSGTARSSPNTRGHSYCGRGRAPADWRVSRPGRRQGRRQRARGDVPAG